MTQEQLKAYLNKLGMDSIPLPTKETLFRLVEVHPERIPFENLDPFDRHLVPKLDFDSIFDKIILHPRGGYCFELNRLFLELLWALGYEAYALHIRIIRGRTWLPAPLHMGLAVMAEGEKYYCDVGFGGPGPRCPIPVKEGAYPCGRDTFRMEEKDNGVWIMYRMDDAAWTQLFYIEDRPAHLIDFTLANFNCATNTEGRFASIRVVNLNLPCGGSKALTGMELVVREGDNVRTETYSNESELRNGLLKEFGIRLE